MDAEARRSSLSLARVLGDKLEALTRWPCLNARCNNKVDPEDGQYCSKSCSNKGLSGQLNKNLYESSLAKTQGMYRPLPLDYNLWPRQQPMTNFSTGMPTQPAPKPTIKKTKFINTKWKRN